MIDNIKGKFNSLFCKVEELTEEMAEKLIESFPNCVNFEEENCVPDEEEE